MRTEQKLWMNRLSVELTAYIIICSSFFAIIGTVIQLYDDYQTEIEGIKTVIRQIESGYLKTISTSLWALDREQLNDTLEGALSFPEIQYLEVREKQGLGSVVVAREGIPKKRQVIRQEFSLEYPSSGNVIGSLVVVANTGKAVQRIKEKIFLILVTKGVKSFLVSLCALIIFQRLIMRHLITITSYFGDFDLSNLDDPLIIQRRTGSRSEPDLLELLTRSINKMRLRLKESLRQRKANEEELRLLRNQLKNIVDSMPSVLIGVDVEGKITQWNKVAERTTGILAAEARGKPLPDVLPWMMSEMEMIFHSIQSRETTREEKKERLSKNGVRYEDVTIYPLVANGVDGAVIRVDNVTEQVRMEEMMIQSEKMLSVGGLAAGMAHEINNPLAGMIQSANVMASRLTEKSGIRANLEAAEEAGTTMEAIRRFMEARKIPDMITAINESGRRVAAIVNNMLSFARKSDAQMSSHDLSSIIDKTLELAGTDYDLKKQYDFKMIEIRKEYSDDVPLVPCDEPKIQQVLLNVFRNGAQAMRTAEVDHPLLIVRILSLEGGKTARIEIEDNGPGMIEEIRKRVFDPFYTTKPAGEGTGLGLSVSYFIITENHRGKMMAVSRPGVGATFIIDLPT